MVIFALIFKLKAEYIIIIRQEA